MTIFLELSAVAALILLNAFFVAAEYALVTARRTRIQELEQQGSRRARDVLSIVAVPPRQPATGRPPTDPCVLSLDELEGLEPVFAAIDAAARAQGIPTDTLITEHGPGQFEINLWHQSDALLAADQAALFKRAVKGCARVHGLVASSHSSLPSCCMDLEV